MSNKSLMNQTMSLAQATKEAPNAAGCYQIYMGDELVYVGKAGDGIRKRFVQYYNGTTAHYSSANKIYKNRDVLTVKWKVMDDPTLVVEQEAKWIRNYKPTWNKQSGWGDKGVLAQSTASSGNGTSYIKNSGTYKNGSVAKDTKSAEHLLSGIKAPDKIIGNMVKGAATSAGITAGIEIAKGIINEESLGTCTEHTVSKSLESATTGAGTILGMEMGSAFGPAGILIGGIAGAVISGEVADGAFDEVGFQAGVIADEIGDRVFDVAFDASMAIASVAEAVVSNPVVEGIGALGENIVCGVFDFFSGWF